MKLKIKKAKAKTQNWGQNTLQKGVQMKNILSKLTAVLMVTVCSAAAMAANYGIGTGMDENRYCYNADRFGKLYGKPVDSRLCASEYKVEETESDGRQCFAADDEGVAFGYAVHVRYCFDHYQSGPSAAGYNACFRADENNETYGYAVKDELCIED